MHACIITYHYLDRFTVLTLHYLLLIYLYIMCIKYPYLSPFLTLLKNLLKCQNVERLAFLSINLYLSICLSLYLSIPLFYILVLHGYKA